MSELGQQFVVTVNTLTGIIEELTERVAALERTLVEPAPRLTGPPSYLSGRWFRRDGTGFGGPIA